MSPYPNPVWLGEFYDLKIRGYIMGYPPGKYSSVNNIIQVNVRSVQALGVFQQFESWLPQINEAYNIRIEQNNKKKLKKAQQELEENIAKEKIRQEVNRKLNEQ